MRAETVHSVTPSPRGDGTMKPFNFTLLVTTLAASIVLCFDSPSWGNVYTKGRHSCEDFARAEKLYKSEPQDIDYEMLWGVCLSLRGRGNDAVEGLSRLRRIAKQHNHVLAALFVTEYVETGGRFQAPIDFDNINEAIFGYGQVLTYVNWDPKYPYGEPIDYRLDENEHQMELRAYYRIPTLYRNKFISGFDGTYHRYLLTSPSYTGKRDLKTYPQYSLYTQDSLDKVIESANRCLYLPLKRHFKPNRYSFNKKTCKALKEEAMALRPLEDKRLVLLATESCRRDLPKCKEYNEIHQQMINIMIEKFSELKAASKLHNISLL